MTLLRIPVLIGLLLVSGPLQSEYGLSRILLTLDSAVSALPTWLGLVGVAVAFVLAATFGRDRRHATPVLILELLAIPVLLLWPEIYADLQRSTLFKSLGVDFIKRIGDAVSGRDEQLAYTNWCATMLLFRSCNLVATAAAVLAYRP